MNLKRHILVGATAEEIHRNLLLALSSTIFLLVIFWAAGIIISSGKSNAASSDNSYKYYTSIEIQKGDTLWSIAEEYITAEYGSVQDYVTEIKALNGLGDDRIHAGQYLTISYYSPEEK